MTDMDAAASLWLSGQALEAGKLLVDSMPEAERPAWAANALALCCELIDDPPREVLAVGEIARDRERWSEAHAAFDAVRRLLLRTEADLRPSRDTLIGTIYVAEATAKVTYNATAPADPFDADSGWWLASNLRWLAERCRTLHFVSKPGSASGGSRARPRHREAW